MRASHGSGTGRLRLALLAGAVAGAVLGASGPAIAAVSDSPPTTPGSTDPVSTVTLLPPPQTTPAPKPDPVPVHVHTTPARTAPVTTAPAQSRAAVTHPSQPAPASTTAPKNSAGSTAHKKQPRIRQTQPAGHHPAPKTTETHARRAAQAPRKPTPMSKTAPQQAPATAPPAVAAGHKGSTWIAPTAGAVLLLLLLAAGLTAAVKGLQRTPAAVPTAPRAEPPFPPPVAKPPLTEAIPEVAVLVAVRAEPPAPPPVEETTQPPAMPSEVGSLPDSCQITWWRGYVKSQFVARTWNASTDDWTPIAESPYFSWRSREPPPESPAAVAAYLELTKTLDRLGWEPDGHGDTWFDTPFRHAENNTPDAVPNETALGNPLRA